MKKTLWLLVAIAALTIGNTNGASAKCYAPESKSDSIRVPKDSLAKMSMEEFNAYCDSLYNADHPWIKEVTDIDTVKITNQTEKDMVLYDGIMENEISIVSGDDSRIPSSISSFIYLIPGETRTFKLEFNKYYDETNKIEKIGFNKIRIMNDDYTGKEKTEEEEASKAEKVYGMEIPLQ